jgi:hypothetical protein
MNHNLPIQPQFRKYGGSNATKQRARDDFNRLAVRIAEHCNRKLANDPAAIQTIYFASVAIEMRVDEKHVWEAISDGGGNGIFVRITPAHREALEPLKRGP